MGYALFMATGATQNKENIMILHSVNIHGKPVRAFLSAEKAAAHAERIDAEVGQVVRNVGDVVKVSFAGHPKQGRIVRFEGRRMIVLLVVKQGAAPVEKSFEIEF
jgi:N6-adenosine-specific RNA methylase IME4